MTEFHLDNSETSWLVYADWLEDQDIDATHIRELNPITNQWNWEYCNPAVGGAANAVVGGIANHVGSYNNIVDVGNGKVGTRDGVGIIGSVGGQG